MSARCRPFGWSVTTRIKLLALGVSIAGIGCRSDPSGISTPAAGSAQFTLPAGTQALVMTIDVSRGAAQLSSSPTSAIAGPDAAPEAGRLLAATRDVATSLLGGDAMSVDIGSIRHSIIGQFQPGRVRLTLEVRIRNALRTVRLIPPTFPVVPSGETILLIPFGVKSVPTPGAATIGPAGNGVAVFAPGNGIAEASVDWDGPLWDFFPSRDQGCFPVTPGCARFEAFSAPLEPQQASEWRVVGFDLDARVRYLRVLLLLAADLQSAA